jgi:hypothetical protein
VRGDELRIGSRIWIYNSNLRVYHKGDGMGARGTIYREHFERYVIVGESRVSWFAMSKRTVEKHKPKEWPDLCKRIPWMIDKLPKRNIPPYRRVCLTDRELDLACWLDEHRYKIISSLERAADPELILKIAEIIEYTPAPPSLTGDPSTGT